MLTTPDAAERHYWPDVLPSGRAVLFTIVRAVTETGETSDLAVLDLETGEQRVLLQGGTHPRYLSSGHLVYSVASTLRAVRFDADRLDVVSDPIPVLERVVTTSQRGTNVDLSDTGTLVYQRSAGVDARTLVWVDRQGNEEPVAAEPRPYDSVRLSPDGRRILTQVNDPSNVDIFIFDLARDTPTRFTTDAGFDGFPIWMPNGERVVFASQRETAGDNQLFWRMADGTGDVERLMAGGVPVSVSPDGRTLVLVENHPETDADIGILSMDGEPTVEWLLQEEFNEISPEVSPDGRWLAYVSVESGQPDVRIRPFPRVDDGAGGGSQGTVEAGRSGDRTATSCSISACRDALPRGRPRRRSW